MYQPSKQGGSRSKYFVTKPRPVKNVGTRREVFYGTAKKTSGGLEQKDLYLNKYHRIVSKKKHLTATKENRLEKYGYFPKKGSFGVIHKNNKTQKNKKSKKTQKNKE